MGPHVLLFLHRTLESTKSQAVVENCMEKEATNHRVSAAFFPGYQPSRSFRKWATHSSERIFDLTTSHIACNLEAPSNLSKSKRFKPKTGTILLTTCRQELNSLENSELPEKDCIQTPKLQDPVRWGPTVKCFRLPWSPWLFWTYLTKSH